MSMPFYVSPEQLMKDRADFARKGIARGRSVVAVQYADGILFASENPSQALHKVSEIYDRIAFAAVGRYNEFENLRIAGVRLADMRGYAYDRRDVTGRGLANAYAQTLGTIFSSGGEKPYEVELFVAEIGDVAADDQLYRLTYDGQVANEHKFAVMGGAADVVATALREHYVEGASLEDAVRLAVSALGHSETEDRVIAADALGRRARPHARAAPQVPEAARAAPDRDPGRARRGRRRRRPGSRGRARRGPAPGQARDPADPTDQVSGATPPLEDPLTGEPPVAPPVAPPARPVDRRTPRRSIPRPTHEVSAAGARHASAADRARPGLSSASAPHLPPTSAALIASARRPRRRPSTVADGVRHGPCAVVAPPSRRLPRCPGSHLSPRLW